MSNGWLVHFSADEEIGLPDAVVRVPPAQLVIGLANAWAFDSQKDSAVAGVLVLVLLAYIWVDSCGLCRSVICINSCCFFA
jgi:hypothetical protein